MIASVSIVIPHLQGLDTLLRTLETVGLQTFPPAETILIDNGTTDGSVEQSLAQFPKLTVHRNETNLGFAGACNQGASKATGEFLLFLNDDVELPSDLIHRLVSYAALNPGVAAVQPHVIRKSDGKTYSLGSLMTKSGFLWHLQGNRIASEAASEPDAINIFAANGCCLLVRAAPFRAIGGFDEKFFAYYEDSDLCWRLRLLGHRVSVIPDCRVIHVVGATTRERFESAHVDYLSFRNRIVSILKNAEARTAAAMVLRHVPVLLGTSLILALRGRTANARATLRALAWPLIHFRDVRDRRASVQLLRTVPDRTALSHVVTNMSIRRWCLLARHYLPWRVTPNNPFGTGPV